MALGDLRSRSRSRSRSLVCWFLFVSAVFIYSYFISHQQQTKEEGKFGLNHRILFIMKNFNSGVSSNLFPSISSCASVLSKERVREFLSMQVCELIVVKVLKSFISFENQLCSPEWELFNQIYSSHCLLN